MLFLIYPFHFLFSWIANEIQVEYGISQFGNLFPQMALLSLGALFVGLFFLYVLLHGFMYILSIDFPSGKPIRNEMLLTNLFHFIPGGYIIALIYFRLRYPFLQGWWKFMISTIPSIIAFVTYTIYVWRHSIF